MGYDGGMHVGFADLLSLPSCMSYRGRELFVRKTIKYCEFCHDVVSTVLSYIAAIPPSSAITFLKWSDLLHLVVAIGFSSTGMIFTVGCRFLLMFLDV